MKSLLIFISYLLIVSVHATHEFRSQGIYREYADKRLELVAKFIPENPVIFEAGGHYGHDTVRFAKRWPQATIISFEPNPHSYEIFLQTTAGLPNVNGYNLAVNNYDGTAVLHVCYGTTGDNPAFEGASSLLDAAPCMQIHYRGPDVVVPCVKLDNWCKVQGIDHFDFMWLDLEGLELQILQSSPEILAKTKVIYTETNLFEFRKNMTQFEPLKKFLESNGFTLAAHWYTEGLQGDAVFVKNEIFK